MWTPRRFLTYLRWAWLIEGASQYFAGQVGLFRAAVITRLREGDRPAFPPTRRDALLLGGTVFDMLERHSGRDACVRMATRLHSAGPRGNLELAFDARMRDIERAWRLHLEDILYPSDSPDASPGDVLQRPDLDLNLDLDTDFSFDPTTPRRSAEREIEEVDDHRGNSHRRDQSQREPRWRPDAG
jgi:hypothetical protein